MTLLLIPTENDKVDAHGDPKGEAEYRELYESTLKPQKEAGKWVFPWEFEVVPGFFRQSDPNTDDLDFNYAVQDFGRVMDWGEMMLRLAYLNQEAPQNVCYKLIFYARHGQGFHNMCVEKYGLAEWNRYWHAQSTDGELVYAPDPQLSPLGLAQAQENNVAWKDQVSKGAPIPDEFYVLPLQRSCNTLLKTWHDIKPATKPVTICELLRETTGRNLCDRRSTKSVILERFGQYNFVADDDVTENDEAFREDYRETMAEHCTRLNKFLQKLFNKTLGSDGTVDRSIAEKSKVVLTTSHAGTIRTLIVVLGHRHFTISTGGMIPIVVKATKRED